MLREERRLNMDKKAMDVANYIVDYCVKKGSPVSNLKLQKLLYYVQAASLVSFGEKLFSDEISAWKYGPVVESVYHNFKIYVDKVITEMFTERDLLTLEDNSKEYDPSALFSKNEKEIITKVLDSYDNYSALAMVKKTHAEKPWRDAYEKGSDFIQTEEIRKFYGKEINLIYGE